MFNKFEIISWKTAIHSALIQAFLSVIVCIIYTYIILAFTGGEEFIGKAHTYKEINGIRHDVVLVVCGVISAFVPILLLRYNSIKFLLLSVLLSSLFYDYLCTFCYRR